MISQSCSILKGFFPSSRLTRCCSTTMPPAAPPVPYPFTPWSVDISTVNPPSLPGSGFHNDLVALYSGYLDIGFATSTPPVDHDPGAGVYEGTGRLGRVLTRRTPVILWLVF